MITTNNTLPKKTSIRWRMIKILLCAVSLIAVLIITVIIHYGFWVKTRDCISDYSGCTVSQKIGDRSLLIADTHGRYLIRNRIVYMIGDTSVQVGGINLHNDVNVLGNFVIADVGDINGQLDGSPSFGDGSKFNADLHEDAHRIYFFVPKYQKGHITNALVSFEK